MSIPIEVLVARVNEHIDHGYWTEVYDDNEPLFFKRQFYCSVCGHGNTYGRPPYCMWCGAKMSKEKPEDKEKNKDE